MCTPSFIKSFPRIQVSRKKLIEKYFSFENCYCRIISSKTGSKEKIFWENVFGRKYLLLKNHFLENRYAGKNKLKKILGRKFLLLQNNFLENRFAAINIVRTFFGSIIFIVAKSFTRKQVCRKKYFENIFLVKNFLLLQNNFLENRLARTNF